MSVEFESMLKDDVLEHVRVNLEMLLLHICEEYNITNGDITPSQYLKFENVREDMAKLLIEFINQNI